MEDGVGLCTVEKGNRMNMVVGILGHHFHRQKKSRQEANTTHLGESKELFGGMRGAMPGAACGEAISPGLFDRNLDVS